MPSIGTRVFSSSRASGLATALVVIAACSSSSKGEGASSPQPAAITCAAPGAPVSGPADMHCGTMVQATDLASCQSDASAPEGDDAAPDAADAGDAAAADLVTDGGPTGDCEPDEFGPTMYGYQGSDDDCKYDVKWSSTDICEGSGGNGVYFTVSATKRVDGTPLTGAAPYIEAVQGCQYPVANPAPPAMTETSEGPPGTYKIGPIIFNRPGVWVVRFHFYGNCADVLPTSPHGHAAFFVNVP